LPVAAGGATAGAEFVAGEYNSGQRMISLYGLAKETPAGIVLTVDHEFGHHIADVDPMPFRGWAEVQRRDMAVSRSFELVASPDELHAPRAGSLGVTKYGGTREGEDIAESLALLRLDHRSGSIARRATGSSDVPVTFGELYPNRAAAIMQSSLGAAFVTGT
jgi:hypothetical protein